MSGAGHGLTAPTLALLRLVHTQPGVSTAALFGALKEPATSWRQFSKRISNLRAKGWLRHDDKLRANGGWHITIAAANVLAVPPGPKPPRPAPCTDVDEDAPTGTPTPPGQIDLMRRATYRPEPSTHYRAGALDALACPSRMGGHRVPYWVGGQ